MHQFFTTAQVAAQIGCHRGYVDREARAGRIPGHKRNGRWLFSLASICALKRQYRQRHHRSNGLLLTGADLAALEALIDARLDLIDARLDARLRAVVPELIAAALHEEFSESVAQSGTPRWASPCSTTGLKVKLTMPDHTDDDD